MENIDTFFEIVEEYLILNDLSGKQFAHKAGLKQQTVSFWLTKKTSPSLVSLIKVADFLDYSLDYLLGRSQSPSYRKAAQSQTFSQRLNFLTERDRKQKIFTSKSSGIDTSTLSRWRRGIITPLPENLIALANYFNVSLDYLVGRSDSL